MKKRIIYHEGGWSSNIGHAFIDIGSMLSLKKATGNDAIIYPISEYPTKLFADGPTRLRYELLKSTPQGVISVSKKLLGKHFEGITTKIARNVRWNVNVATVNNALDLVNAVKAEYVVFSGMRLTIDFLNKFGKILTKLKKRNIKIILNAVGGLSYSDIEVEEVRRKLTEIEPYALISRNDIAFKNYHDLARHSLNGIDCVFFVNELPAVKEIELDLPDYVVFSFDTHDYLYKRLEPEYQHYMIIRTSHFFDKNPRARFYKKNMLVSDSPYDYLILYAHAKEVHTDRVHACVPTLSFGNPCRLYIEAPRTAIFEKVGANQITEKLVYPDTTRIEREKQKQIDFLSSIIT